MFLQAEIIDHVTTEQRIIISIIIIRKLKVTQFVSFGPNRRRT